MTHATIKRFLKSIRNFFTDPLPRRGVLVIEKIQVTDVGIDFNYLVKSRNFRIHMTLPARLLDQLKLQMSPPFEQALTAIGVALSAQLFKITDFRSVEIRSAALDEESLRFFEDFYLRGLAEFRYLQGLNPSRRVEVICTKSTSVEPLTARLRDHALLLNGGGKDTAVAAELLGRGGQDFSWVTIDNNDTRRKLITISSSQVAIDIEYDVDRSFERNLAYVWGHTPQASIFLSVGALLAVLTKSRYVLAGNEKSANSGNTLHRDLEINHQFTKSFMYERAFSDFVKRRICSDLIVCSVLRPFHDLQLSELFSQLKNYHPHFVSCNRGIRSGNWCKQCAKCAFTALAIGPFVSQEDLSAIFNADIFSKPQIRRYVIELASGSTKPWECVGTVQECKLALRLLLAKYPTLDFSEYPRRGDLVAASISEPAGGSTDDLLTAVSDEHLIPEQLLTNVNAGLKLIGRRSLSIPRSKLTIASAR